MLIAVLFFAIMNIIVKALGRIPAYEVVFFRVLVSSGLCLILLKSMGIPIVGNNKKLLIMRGLAGSCALFLYFITLQNMPLAGAVTIQFLSPIFATFLAGFMLGEKTNKFQWIGFVIAFSGVLLVKGFDTRIAPLYFFLGILSAFFSGIAYNYVRKLKNTDHPLVVVMYFPLITLPLAAPYTILNWTTPTGVEWFYLGALGIVTQIAQYFMTKSMQLETLATVTPIKYLGVIYAVLFGYFIFDEHIEWLSLVGMCLVFIGIFVCVKMRKIAPKQH